MKFISYIVFLILYSISVSAQQDVRQFIFGYSLLDHRPPAVPTPSDETMIPHWLYLLADQGNHGYGATGRYGFLQQHINLPSFAQC
jgi:hypothetical protein